MEITVKTKVTGQQIADLMITALEGGSNYWLDRFWLCTDTPPNRYQPKDIWYADPGLWESSAWLVHAYEEDEPDESRIIFGPKQLAQGMQRLAEMRPKLFADIVNNDGDYDALDADVALQIILLGEVRYG